MNVSPSISLPVLGTAPMPAAAVGVQLDVPERVPATAAPSELKGEDGTAGDPQPNAAVDEAETDRGLTERLTPEEQQEVRELAARDREVRAHEQAHATVGGQYAGAPSYTYERAPDGRQYAVAGEVSIDVSPVPGDPQATIDKARIVRRAALAPAEPSSQDRAVAAEATKLEQQARVELLAQSEQSPELGKANASNDSATLFYVPIDEKA